MQGNGMSNTAEPIEWSRSGKLKKAEHSVNERTHLQCGSIILDYFLRPPTLRLLLKDVRRPRDKPRYQRLGKADRSSGGMYSDRLPYL